jgi:enamine deaminase RidA (YjgF/YER057c/UK114 family)/DNA-binding XRE family transcriptional regulator
MRRNPAGHPRRHIVELRKRLGLTQEGLGERIGRSAGMIHHIEIGETKEMRHDVVLRLAEVLGTTPDYIRYGEESPGGDASFSATSFPRSEAMQILQPAGWPRPKGYSNGIAAEGRLVFVAGQIGWDEREAIVSDDLVAQIEQVLANTLAVLREAGAGPEHVVRMTWYIADREAYLARRREIGVVWRRLMGKVFPAMAMVVVAGLIEERAKVEIETTAVLP